MERGVFGNNRGGCGGLGCDSKTTGVGGTTSGGCCCRRMRGGGGTGNSNNGGGIAVRRTRGGEALLIEELQPGRWLFSKPTPPSLEGVCYSRKMPRPRNACRGCTQPVSFCTPASISHFLRPGDGTYFSSLLSLRFRSWSICGFLYCPA